MPSCSMYLLACIEKLLAWIKMCDVCEPGESWSLLKFKIWMQQQKKLREPEPTYKIRVLYYFQVNCSVEIMRTSGPMYTYVRIY